MNHYNQDISILDLSPWERVTLGRKDKYDRPRAQWTHAYNYHKID